MPSQFKLTDLLNILSIGVLLELEIIGFIYIIDNQIIKVLFSQKDWTALIISCGLILAMPLWRYVSNFSEFLMYPIKKQSPLNSVSEQTLREKVGLIYQNLFYFIRKSSRWIFFGLLGSEGLDKSTAIEELRNSTSIVDKKIWEKMTVTFSLTFAEEDNTDNVNIYGLVNSYIAIKSKDQQSLSSYRYNMVFNYHSRLAYTLHIGLRMCLLVLILPYLITVVPLIKPIFTVGIALVLFYLSRHFGKQCKIFHKRETQLLFKDFYITAISSEKSVL